MNQILTMASKIKKNKELSGRVAFITGGSRGIGLDIALSMAREGASIAICGRSRKHLDEALILLKETGVKCVGYVADSSDLKQVEKTLDNIKKDFKGLDILVNNIGRVGHFSDFEGLSDLDWKEAFDINIMSTVRFTRASFPLLKVSKHARIINMASVAGKRPGNFIPNYGAMKAGIIHLSKYLSNQWGKYGILVNSISPHTVKGGSWYDDLVDRAKRDGITITEAKKIMIKEITSKTVINSMAELDDVSNLAVYLASDKAKFITGQCLTVDGGAVNSIY